MSFLRERGSRSLATMEFGKGLQSRPMRNQTTHQRTIWAAGTGAGITALVQQLLMQLRADLGPDAVVQDSTNVVLIKWPGLVPLIAIQRDPANFRIRAATPQTRQHAISGNRALETSHRDFIEPLKEHIGGVATGIGYESEDES